MNTLNKILTAFVLAWVSCIATVSAQNLKLTFPNGGDTLYTGSTVIIGWQTATNASISHVNIEFSVNNGISWYPITTRTVNGDSFHWTVPLTISTHCLVRVSDIENIGIKAESEKVFAIAMPWKWVVNTDTSNSVGTCMAIDKPGNIYVSGYFYSYAKFGTTELRNDDYFANIFLAKANSDGEWLWAVCDSGGNHNMSTPNSSTGMTLDKNGDIYITGRFNNSVVFGKTVLSQNGGNEDTDNNDIFVAKADSNGVWQWAVSGGGEQDDYSNGIALDSIGNIYITGSFKWFGRFGNTTLYQDYGKQGIFVAKLDKGGTWKWAVSGNNNPWSTGTDIAVDASGNCYVTGSFDSKVITFDSVSLFNKGSVDAFVAKFDSEGKCKWAVSSEGSTDEAGLCIALDQKENCFVAGGMKGSGIFGGKKVFGDGFIARLSMDGAWEWAVGGSGNWSDFVLDTSGKYSYVVGNFQRNTKFGNFEVLCNDSRDIFIGKLNNLSGEWEWVATGGGGAYYDFDIGLGVASDGKGGIYATGRCAENAKFGKVAFPILHRQPLFLGKIEDLSRVSALTLTSPNGGEFLYAGSTATITWTTADITIKHVNIEFSPDRGISWTTIATAFANTGSFEWSLPLLHSTQSVVRISDTQNSYFTDTSDEVFSILMPTITILSPNGGETFYPEKLETVRWITADAPLSRVDIEYSLDNCVNWTSIAKDADNTGSYPWKIPIAQSRFCRLRVANSKNPAICDTSNNVFVISMPLEIITPNGGERFHAGSQISVSWGIADTSITRVNLDYSLDGGAHWITIISDYNNSGSYLWNVPFAPSSKCLLRISNTQNNSISDESDAVFTIIPPVGVSAGSELLRELGISLVPNPTSGTAILRVGSDFSGWVKVEAYSILGENFGIFAEQECMVGTTEFSLMLEQLPVGMYFLRITTPDGIQTLLFERMK